MQLVSCDTAHKLLLSHSSCITLAAQEELAVPQLSSSLAYFFIYPENSPIPPFSPPSIVHCTMLRLTRPRTFTCTHTCWYPYSLIPPLASNHDVLYQLALVLEIETLTKTILRAQKTERFALGARGGHVACATEMRDGTMLISLVEDPLKKSTTLSRVSNQIDQKVRSCPCIK
jgi:hypothetical protein